MIKKHNRRSFLKTAMTGLVGFLVSNISLTKQGIHKTTKPRSLKEADFYKKHNLSG